MRLVLLAVSTPSLLKPPSPIDRRALVARHNPRLECKTLPECDPMDFQTLGNGRFAFTADATGVQTLNGTTLPNGLANPLNTMAGWGWHTTPVHKSSYRSILP